MDREDIIVLPHKNLRKKSKNISVFDTKLEALCSNMESATLDWEDNRSHELGVALAAVQVNILSKVIIIRNDFENKSDRSFLTLINPKIIRREGEQKTDYEGCLSVPDIYGLVSRSDKIKIKAQDMSGNEFRLKAEGFLARVLQHEIDHTNGIMFVDHIKKSQDAFFQLDPEGKLNKVDYDQVNPNNILW